MAEKILVVEDEPEIAELIGVYLNSEGFQTILCGTAAQAKQAIRTESIALALLDILLPDQSGFSLCADIRTEHSFPIIMLTALTEDAEKITGLTIGADDYMTKPFNPLELVARVKAQLRRSTRYNGGGPEKEKDTLEINGLEISRTTHQCWLYGQEIALTPKEFEILWLLCQRRGQVVSAKELFERVWKEKYLDNNNTIMVHIRRLREKLGEPRENPRFIHTVWGVGYRVD